MDSRFRSTLAVAAAGVVSTVFVYSLALPSLAERDFDVRWQRLRARSDRSTGVGPISLVGGPFDRVRGPSHKIEDLIKAEREAMCSRAVGCPGGISADTELCMLFLEERESPENGSLLIRAVREGEVTFNAQRAVSALETYAGLPCHQHPASPLKESLTGLRKVGQSCLSSWSCEADADCKRPSRTRLGRTVSDHNVTGVCAAPGWDALALPIGAVCGAPVRGFCAGGFCDAEASRCAPYRGSGKSCSRDGECDSRWCDGGLCRQRLLEGEACDPRSRVRRCRAPLTCHEGRCSPMADLGQRCSIRREQGGRPFWTMAPLCRLGLACVAESLGADWGTCLPRRDEGETCSTDFDCRRGLCLNGLTCRDPYWPAWIPFGIRRATERVNDIWYALFK